MLVAFRADRSSSHKGHYMLHLHYSNREKMSPRKAHHHTFKDNPYAEDEPLATLFSVALTISSSSLANKSFKNLQLNSECINAFPGNVHMVFYTTIYM